jgi:hypothetical protein
LGPWQGSARDALASRLSQCIEQAARIDTARSDAGRLHFAAVKAVLQVLEERGGTGAAKDRMITCAEWTELTGLPEARTLEERYGTDDARLPGFTTGASEPPERR